MQINKDKAYTLNWCLIYGNESKRNPSLLQLPLVVLPICYNDFNLGTNRGAFSFYIRTPMTRIEPLIYGGDKQMNLKQIILGLLLMILWLPSCTPTATEPAAEPAATVPADGVLTEVDSDQADESSDAYTDNDGETAAERINFDTVIVYTKEGRFPGSPQEWTIYADGRVSDGAGQEWQAPAAAVEALFASTPTLASRGTTAEYGVENCRDCLTHTVTISGADEKATKIVYSQGQDGWPAELEPLFTNLNQLIETVDQ